MSRDQQGNANPQQLYNDLSNEVADILLDSSSPVRGSAEFDQLISEHDQLHSRQAELKDLETKLTEVLPGLELAENNLIAARKKLAAEKKKLAAYASELGKTAFAGLRSGELPDHQIFSDRKKLQSHIENLQRQRAELRAGENAGMLDKAKLQAQQLKLAGQIKLEELRIKSVDRALGEAMLRSKEKLSVQCDQTKEILKKITHQKDQVLIARDKIKSCKKSLRNQKIKVAQTLNRPAAQTAGSLRSEMKVVQRELRRNEEDVGNIRESLIARALELDLLCEGVVVGQKLQDLSSLRMELAENEPEWIKLVNESKSWFLGLSTKQKTGVYVAAGTATLVLFIVMITGGDAELSPPAAGLTKAVNPNEESDGSLILSEEDTLRELKQLGAKITQNEDGVTIFFDSNTSVSSLPSLEPIADLNGLIINNGSLAGDKLAAIQNAKTLSGLVLIDCQINDDALVYLKGLRSLRLLVLNNNKITGKALDHIVGLRELRILALRRAKIEDSSLRHLKGLTQLQELDLSLTPIRGSGLGVTQYMPNLRKLDLHTCLLLEGLPMNSGNEALGRLEELNLQGCVKLPPTFIKRFNSKSKVQSAIEDLVASGNNFGRVSVEIQSFVAKDFFCSKVVNEITIKAFQREFPSATELKRDSLGAARGVREFKSTEFFRYVFLDGRLVAIMAQGPGSYKSMPDPNKYEKVFGNAHAGLDDKKVRAAVTASGRPESASVWYLDEFDLAVRIWHYSNGFQIATFESISGIEQLQGR
jgi:Leucine-rich repeat (LRR) protein